MATLDELLADAKAKERELKDKRTALKNASQFTASKYYNNFIKDPKNKSKIDELRANQAAAKAEVEAADVAFKAAKKLADKAVEEKKLNPDPEEKQRLQDEASRKGEVYQDPESNQSVTVDIDYFTKKIEVAGRYIAELNDEGRKLLAQQLNAIYKSKLPEDGKYSAELKSAYIRALTDNLIRSTDFNQNISFEEFLVVAENEGTYQADGKTGDNNKPFGSLSVWDKTKTKTELTTLFSNLGFDRDPTEKEINNIYAKVDKKQKEQKATVTKYKMINGVRTQVTTPGFNQIQFVTDLIKSTQEYKDIVDKKTKQEESKTLVSAQTLKGVADRNGITLSPEQLDTFTLRIKKGEDISLIQNEIRKLAAIGRPDNVKKLIESGVDLSTIYSPYKEVLAQTLEINPNGITLNDPALRMAIGPDKEMSLYDYQRALRKDPRWQYTDNARQTVSSGLTQVLRDFGFQG
jgi:hypothetical protein